MPDILKFLEEIQRLKREKEDLKILVAKLRDALMGLVKDLNEMYGLHLNVDPTPWSDLLTGGKYEEWACQLIVEDCVRITETVREALAKLRQEMERRNTL